MRILGYRTLRVYDKTWRRGTSSREKWWVFFGAADRGGRLSIPPSQSPIV